MKRLFAAVKITPAAEYIRIYNLLKSGLIHERITWVNPTVTHLTLKFLGETDEKLIPSISKALRRTADHSPSLELNIRRTGVFGSRYDPRVIWFGIEENPGLTLLANNTRNELTLAGWPLDRQNFVPHLTIGRIKEIRDKSLFRDVLVRFRDLPMQVQAVKEIILYESILHREGPEYLAMEKFELGEKTGRL